MMTVVGYIITTWVCDAEHVHTETTQIFSPTPQVPLTVNELSRLTRRIDHDSKIGLL